MAASAVIVACEPLLPAVRPPPLLLRQASLHSTLRFSTQSITTTR
jgi:hypothetical protein